MFKFNKDRFDANPRLEAQAFYDGAHHLTQDSGLAQLDAQFCKESSELQGASIKRQKTIEADIKHLEEMQPEYQRDYEVLRAKLGDESPQLVVPLLIALSGAGALIGEAIMLAPSLDAIGIANPVAQLAAALSLAAFTATIFHLAFETVLTNRWSFMFRIIWRVLGIWGLISMTAWGVMRGYQVAFAADISENPLGQFLRGHPLLASIFYVFVTLGAPLAAAGALTYSASHIREAVQYYKAKNKAMYVSRHLPILTKSLESERESLKHGLKAIDEKGKQWKGAYSLFHERGQKRGALKPPFWTVVLKASLFAILALIVVSFLVLAHPLFLLFPIAVFIAAFLYFRHERNHPTPSQFFSHENVNFWNGNDDFLTGGGK